MARRAGTSRAGCRKGSEVMERSAETRPRRSEMSRKVPQPRRWKTVTYSFLARGPETLIRYMVKPVDSEAPNVADLGVINKQA